MPLRFIFYKIPKPEYLRIGIVLLFILFIVEISGDTGKCDIPRAGIKGRFSLATEVLA